MEAQHLRDDSDRFEAERDAALALLREIAGHLCDCGTECYSGPERQSRIDAFLASHPQETP